MAAFLGAVISTALPLILAALSDSLVVAAQNRLPALAWILSFQIAAVIALGFLVSILAGAAEERACQEAITESQASITEQLLRQPYALGAGLVKERLVDDLSDLIIWRVSTLPRIAVSLVGVITALIWVYLASPWALTLALGGVVLTVLPSLAVKKWAEEAYEDTTDIESAINSEYFQARENLDLIRTEKLQAYIEQRVRALDRTHLRAGTKSEATGAAESSLNNLVQAAALYGSLLLALWLVGTNRLALSGAVGLVIVLKTFFTLASSTATNLTAFWVVRRKRRRLRTLECAFSSYGATTNHSSAALDLQDVTVRREGAVMAHVNALHLARGKTMLIAGQNGAGKSLLLRAVIGLDERTGRVASAYSSNDLRMGYLSQHDPLLSLTVRELFEHIEGAVGDGPARAAETLTHLLGPDAFTTLGDVPVRSLSGGQRRSVFIAETVASSQGVLLLDEPDTHLSPEAAQGLASLLNEYEGSVIAIAHTPRFSTPLSARTVTVERPVR